MFASKLRRGAFCAVGLGATAFFANTANQAETESKAEECASAEFILRDSAVNLSAAGVAVPVSPSTGKPLTLMQAQVCFRHGHRYPISTMPDGVLWDPKENDLSNLQQSMMCKLNIFYPGSSTPLPLSRVPLNHGEERGNLPGGGLPGALTKTGLLQTFDLGQELRRRYVDEDATDTAVRPQFLLPPHWSNDTSRQVVQVRSTKTRRTLESARGVLSGLYPEAARSPDNRMEVDILLNGEPEYMVYNPRSCARMEQLRALADEAFFQSLRGEKSPGAEPYEKFDLPSLVASIESAKGWECEVAKWKLIVYRDEYACRRVANMPVPDSVEAVAVPLNKAAAQQMREEWDGVTPGENSPSPEGVSHERLRLSIGRMMGLIAERLHRPDGRLHIYSAHDWTVAPLLLCVARREDPELSMWAPFCSNISFELWTEAEDLNADYSHKQQHPRRRIQHWPTTGPSSDTPGTFVRAVFNGHVVDMKCSEDSSGLCRLADFQAMVQGYCVKDYRSECKILEKSDDNESQNKLTVI